MPMRSMKAGLILVVLACDLTAACPCFAQVSPQPGAEVQPWRAYVPAGTLALGSCRSDLESLEADFVAAMDDLTYEYVGSLTSVRHFSELLNFEPGAGRVVLGAAETQQADSHGGDPCFFALIPVASYEEAVRDLGAEQVGDIAVLGFLGLEFCLAPCGEWIFVTSLEHQDVARQASLGNGQLRPRETLSDVHLEMDNRGLELLTEWSAEVSDSARRRHGLRELLRWPPSLEAVQAAISQNGPLMAACKELFAGADLGLSFDKTSGMTWQMRGDLSNQSDSTAVAIGHEFPEAIVGNALATFSGPGQGPLSDTLESLCLAYTKGRPDEVEAKQYDEEAFAAFQESFGKTRSHVRWCHAALLPHAEGPLPLYSNQAVLLTVDDFEGFAGNLRASFMAWNELVRTSNAQLAVLFAHQPFQEGVLRSDSFSVDMVEALFDDAAPEVRKIFEQFYGKGGRYVWRSFRLDDNRVLLTDLPREEAESLARQVAAEGDTQPAEELGTWRAKLKPAALMRWQARVQQVMAGRPVDRRMGKPEAAPPRVDLRADVVDGQIVLSAQVTRQALRSIGGELRKLRQGKLRQGN